MGGEDERTLVHLLTDQIEFAYVVILNKVDDAGPQKVDAALLPVIAASDPKSQPDLPDPFPAWQPVGDAA